MNDNKALPTAKQMIPNLLGALRSCGGAATVRELEMTVARDLQLSPDQLAIPHDKSRTEFQYRLAWSRSYAKKDGLVTSARRNHWELASHTNEG